MIVGIVTGTYSSVFIAAAIAVIWQSRVEAGQTGASAPPPGRRNAEDRKPAPRVVHRRRAAAS
jgi:hypothetical protein